MTDEPSGVPPKQPVSGNSQRVTAWRRAVEMIQVVAENTDRETAAKIFAVVIACGYLLAVVVQERAVAPVVSLSIVLLVPLGLIWFPEELGGFTGYVSRGGNIDTETPPGIVTFLGWLILVLIGIPVVAFSLGYK